MSKRKWKPRRRGLDGRRKPAGALQHVTAGDGYTNAAAFLGEASPIMQAGDYTSSSLTADIQKLTNIYRTNWIGKRIVDAPAEDMTREWYSVVSEMDGDKVKELQKLESKHAVQEELTNAIRWARLYGGSACLMVIAGQEDMLDMPLDMELLMPGCFRGLLVIDKTMGLEPSIELEEDMDDPEFGYPMYYDVWLDSMRQSSIRVHHSRLLQFRGRMLPRQEEIGEGYWGASEFEHIYEELQKRDTTSANIAQLVFHANVRTLKMGDYGEALLMGTDAQKSNILQSMALQNRMVTSFGVQVMSADDSMENHPYSFSGISDVYEQFMMDMSGAAEIPATRLFGRAPQGMNATGESDMKQYYESISRMQERALRPALEKLLPILCMSLWGMIPDDLEIAFEPLMTTSPQERASIMSQFTTAVVSVFSAGLIGRKTALSELRELGSEMGAWTKISDETIEEADDQVDGGEMGMGDPMGGMMGDPGADPDAETQTDESPEEQHVPLAISAKDGKGYNPNRDEDGKFASGNGDQTSGERSPKPRFTPYNDLSPGGKAIVDEFSKRSPRIDQRKQRAHMNAEESLKASNKRTAEISAMRAAGKQVGDVSRKSHFNGISEREVVNAVKEKIQKGEYTHEVLKNGFARLKVKIDSRKGVYYNVGDAKNGIPTSQVVVVYSKRNGLHVYPIKEDE